MNFEYYRNFTFIVDCGTFSAASQKLLIAQPALSNQVKALESEYGTQLLHRGSRRLELTASGKILYERAKAICYLENSIKHEIQASVSGHTGILRLGLTHASVDPYIERLLLAFHDEYPGVQFEIFLNTSAKNIESLNDDKLDVAFIRVTENSPSGLNYLSTVEENLVAYFSKDNPWFAPSPDYIDVAELKGIPLCLTIGLRDKLGMLCQQADFTPYILCAAATRNQALIWSIHNLAITILFCNSTHSLSEHGLLSRKVTSLGSPVTALRSFVTSSNRVPSATASLFLEFVKNYTADL